MRCAIILLFCSISCFGQAGRAELFGTIQDPSGLPVSGAGVRARAQATRASFSAVSNAAGQYHLLGLPTGQYEISIEQPGFRTYRQPGFTLRVGDQTELNVSLEVGPSSQSVEVTASASLLQTTGGDVGFHLDERKITALPLDGRSFIPLVALSPGVALPNGSLLPRINGSRPRTNEYLYDGVSVLQPEPGQVAWTPIIDGIAEFRLNINAYSPEYGRSNGGTVMVIGRSGSNDLHGTLFEFLRNEALNARNYFAPAGSKPEFRRNQYGLALGGPIQKSRTFFFVDWQRTRLRTGITRISTVPTLQQRQGIFSAAIYDPVSVPRQPFADRMIPAQRIDAVARQVLQRYPFPTSPGVSNNYSRTAIEPDDQDQFDTRVDRYFGSRHRLFARYTYLSDDDTPVTPFPDGSGSLTSGVIGHAVTRADGVVAEHAWTLSPGALNQVRFGYSRRNLRQLSLETTGIAIPGIPASAFSSALPVFALAGYQQIGPATGANSRNSTSVTEFLDTFSLVRGRHTIKLGVDFRREAAGLLNPPNPGGMYTFNITGTNNASVPNSGNSFASLLLGQVNAFSIDIQNQVIQERAHIAEFFLGDEWRISSKLTLNIGTRYTLNFPSTISNGTGAVFNLQTQALDFPRTARELECCNFGPRAGLAYRIGDTWVVRAGYGMVWFEQTGITSPFTIPQFPIIQTVGQQSPDNVNPAFVLASGPSVEITRPSRSAGLGQGVFGADRHNGSGYSQQWNFTIQKTLGDFNIEAGYLGSRNTRLGIPDANINQLPAQYLSLGPALLSKVANPYAGQVPVSSSLGGPTITRQQLLRAFPRYTTVALFRNNVGNSSYHAMDAKLEKRFSRGLTVTAAYTFSKLIDDASSVFSQSVFSGPVLNNTGAADAFNRRLEKDLSSGDIPRVFALGWVYEIPRLGKIAGWQVAGIVRIQAGDTVAVTQATNLNANLGYAVQRPNRAGDPNLLAQRSATEWFNAAVFSQAPQFTIGTSSRNPVRGPGLQNADLMLGKTFRLTEQSSLEFRAEAFNVSNTPPLNDPNGSFGSSAFGSITSAGNPRVFEAAAKLRF